MAYDGILLETATAALQEFLDALGLPSPPGGAGALVKQLLTFTSAAKMREAVQQEVRRGWLVDVVKEANRETAEQVQAATELLSDFIRNLNAGRYTPGYLEFLKGHRAGALHGERILTFGPAEIVTARVRTFVGREWLLEEIGKSLDAAVVSPNGGYVVVEGHPGTGKTSLMSALVHRRGYVHHFNVAKEGTRTPTQFIGNACAQLAVRYGIDEKWPSELKGGFFRDMLKQARLVADAPVVVLVDALDEAESPPPGDNTLLLPDPLPNGVAVVVSRRPEDQRDHPLVVDQVKRVTIEEEDSRNRADIRLYLREAFNARPGEAAALSDDTGRAEDDIIDIITDHARGNFMYAVHVGSDLLGEKRILRNHDDFTLPRGLEAYYAMHWRMMAAEADGELALDVARVLAAAEAPLQARDIARIIKDVSGADVPKPGVDRVLRQWRQFLSLDERTGKWRLYHLSFRDYVAKQVDLRRYARLVSERWDSSVRDELDDEPD